MNTNKKKKIKYERLKNYFIRVNLCTLVAI